MTHPAGTPAGTTVWESMRRGGPLTLLGLAVALGSPPLLLTGRPAFATIVLLVALGALAALSFWPVAAAIVVVSMVISWTRYVSRWKNAWT